MSFLVWVVSFMMGGAAWYVSKCWLEGWITEENKDRPQEQRLVCGWEERVLALLMGVIVGVSTSVIWAMVAQQ